MGSGVTRASARSKEGEKATGRETGVQTSVPGCGLRGHPATSPAATRALCAQPDRDRRHPSHHVVLTSRGGAGTAGTPRPWLPRHQPWCSFGAGGGPSVLYSEHPSEHPTRREHVMGGPCLAVPYPTLETDLTAWGSQGRWLKVARDCACSGEPPWNEVPAGGTLSSHHSPEMCLWGQKNTPPGGPGLIPKGIRQRELGLLSSGPQSREAVD